MSDNYIRDALGWVDDFRALPGECGHDLTRRIYAHSLMLQGVSVKQLKELGFSKDVIAEIFEVILEETYNSCD